METYLKFKYCDYLIQNGKVKLYDVIHHNYTQAYINGGKSYAMSHNVAPTLDTRCDYLGGSSE